MPARTRVISMRKIRSKLSLYPHRYFTEHLVDAFKKSPQESNLNQEPSNLWIRRLKNHIGLHLQQSLHRTELGDQIDDKKKMELEKVMNSENRSLAAAEKLSTRGVRLGESLDAALTQPQRNHSTASLEQEQIAACRRGDLETRVPAENSGKKKHLER
jgi:hypothetical protein